MTGTSLPCEYCANGGKMAAAELPTARATAGGTGGDWGGAEDEAEWRAVVKGVLLSAGGRVISLVAARSAGDISTVVGYKCAHR